MAKRWKVVYYETKNNTSPVEDFINSLPTNNRLKVMAFLEVLQEQGPNLPRPYADILKDGIHELRVKLTGNQYRVLYFFCYEHYIVLTNAFQKNTSAVPETEIKLAKNFRDDFLSRTTLKDMPEV